MTQVEEVSACENACAECDTHRGSPMIHVDFIDRTNSIASVATVCMHCHNPTCAQVCPADAIKMTDDGVVQSSLKPRCVACSNCVLACPFGVPKMNTSMNLMMKCDMCYDRTSVGLKPMCASVCPSQALAFGTREEIAALRPGTRPVDTFRFGAQLIRTKVNVLVPKETVPELVDVTAAMYEPPLGRDLLDAVFDADGDSQ